MSSVRSTASAANFSISSISSTSSGHDNYHLDETFGDVLLPASLFDEDDWSMLANASEYENVDPDLADKKNSVSSRSFYNKPIDMSILSESVSERLSHVKIDEGKKKIARNLKKCCEYLSATSIVPDNIVDPVSPISCSSLVCFK